MKVVVFDLDGTLIRGETVCEVLARPLGKLPRMRELEKLSQKEEIKRAREEIALWYSGCAANDLLTYLEKAQLAPGAIEGCRLLISEGIDIALASLTWSFAVEWFAKLVGATSWIGSDLDGLGAIRHRWPLDKVRFIQSIMNKRGLRDVDVAAVGDSWGDIPMLELVGLPIFVGALDAKRLPNNTICLPNADIRDVAKAIIAN
ncbi:MAG: HAD family hydrolase [Thermoleophilia bacterium]